MNNAVAYEPEQYGSKDRPERPQLIGPGRSPDGIRQIKRHAPLLDQRRDRLRKSPINCKKDLSTRSACTVRGELLFGLAQRVVDSLVMKKRPGSI